MAHIMVIQSAVKSSPHVASGASHARHMMAPVSEPS